MIPSSETLARAKTLIESIEKLQAELTGLFKSQPAAAAPPAVAVAVAPKRRGRPPGAGKKSGMSAEGRERIAAAAKARWAKFHAQQGSSQAKSAPAAAPAAAAPASPGSGRRKMSAAGRAAIIAAQKARWAKIRGQKKFGKA